MKKSKKILSAVLALTTVFSATAVNATAIDEQAVDSIVNNTTKVVKSVTDGVGSNFDAASTDFTISKEEFKRETETHGFVAALIKTGTDAINILVQALMRRVCQGFGDPVDWKNISEYSAEKEHIYFGRDTYHTSASESAQWKLGYDSASLIPSDFKAGKYSLGRSLVVSTIFQAEAKADSVLDDQRVRVFCVDEGTGEGAVVVAVIDGLGTGSAEIRAIRSKLQPYVDSGKISSINVSSTHSHSALDTQGVSSPCLYVLATGFFNNKNNIAQKAPTATDAFRDNMVNVVADTIENAYKNMEAGKLYYDKADISKYVYDKRELQKVPEVGILHFVPDNKDSKETYIANISCHPTSVSADNAAVSGDWIYYLDKNFQAVNCNFEMIQGSVGQLTRNIEPDTTEQIKEKVATKYQKKELSEDSYEDLRDTIPLAETFFGIIYNAKNDGEESLNPVINVHHKEITLTTTNYILRLALQSKLVGNVVYRTGDGVDDVCLPSEVGYLEFGNRMAFGIYPAEFYPEVFHGNAVGADKSWNGTEWQYKSMNEEVGKYVDGIDVYCMCFANDYIGYVVTDNYYAFLGHQIVIDGYNCWGAKDGGAADEILCAGRSSASNIIGNFLTLVKDYTSEK